MFDLGGQTALVTGASRGIGKKIALVLAEAGANLALAARTREALRETAREIESLGRKVVTLAMDVADTAQVEAGVEEAAARFERIDVLVNNAGITRDGLLLRMKDEDWRQVMSTNLDGVFHVTRQTLPLMLKRRYGRIVNIVSVVAQSGNPGQANYVASKAAVIGFTKSLAREVASRNITVNAVAPGFIETDMTAGLGEKALQDLKSGIPLKRVGTVDDIAAGTLYLASPEAGYVTGHVLSINGGMYM